MTEKTIVEGYAIVVCDKGFVYVGDVTITDNWILMKNAKNIRKWGTTKGLGELAISGPTDSTVLDETGSIRIPIAQSLPIIETEKDKWM